MDFGFAAPLTLAPSPAVSPRGARVLAVAFAFAASLTLTAALPATANFLEASFFVILLAHRLRIFSSSACIVGWLAGSAKRSAGNCKPLMLSLIANKFERASVRRFNTSSGDNFKLRGDA